MERIVFAWNLDKKCEHRVVNKRIEDKTNR